MEQSINSISYQYQILRYRHDHLAGEFANLGIVYFDAETRTVKAKFIDKYGRLSKFFGKISHLSLLQLLRQLEKQFIAFGKNISTNNDLVTLRDIEELTTQIFPKDNNALFFSKTYNGWHFEHQLAFNELYDKIIERYQEKKGRKTDDSFAWRNIYKRYFDEYNITPKLKPQEIKTKSTTLKFDKTVQNGALHCFQGLSFDLKTEEAIKDKIFRWDGKLRELATAKQPMKVYLLSLMSDNEQLNQMVEDKLSSGFGNVTVQVIHEAEAAKVASEVSRLLNSEH